MDSRLTISKEPRLTVISLNGQPTEIADKLSYRPGDIISAVIELHSHQALVAESLRASFVGQTRVWTHPAELHDVFETLIYTHVNQSYNLPLGAHFINSVGVQDVILIPFDFTIPELVAGRKEIINHAPPSCKLGSLYVDPWGRSYMQPLIEYALQVRLQFRLAHETAFRWTYTRHVIAITASPRDDPPTYVPCPLQTAIASRSVDITRTRFSSSFARLDLSMAEPNAVAESSGHGYYTSLRLQLTWNSATKAYDEVELGKRRIWIEYQLQAKTQYCTNPYYSGKPATSSEVRWDSRTEESPLGCLQIRLGDCNTRLVNSKDFARCHTGSISIPIQIDRRTTPTFSHMLASRSYAILAKVEIEGLQHNKLSLEVPLQICGSLAFTAGVNARDEPWIDPTMLCLEAPPEYLES